MALYRHTSQEALNILPPESLALPPVNGQHSFSFIQIFNNISLRSKLEAKAFLLSPAELGVVFLLKHLTAMNPQAHRVCGFSFLSDDYCNGALSVSIIIFSEQRSK